MKRKKAVLWGVGNIAEVVWFYLTNDSEYEVCAFCVDREYKTMDEFHGKPVVCFDEMEEKYSPTEYLMSIPISYKHMNMFRTQKYEEAKEKGYHFVTYISSKATYYGTSVGENTIIMENNVIQPFSQVGNNVIMWSGNHLGHHSKIGDNCFVASHVVISGSTQIGDNSFIGVNAAIRDNLSIGKFNLIGAGALILNDTSDYDVYTAKGGTAKIPKKSVDVGHI